VRVPSQFHQDRAGYLPPVLKTIMPYAEHTQPPEREDLDQVQKQFDPSKFFTKVDPDDLKDLATDPQKRADLLARALTAAYSYLDCIPRHHETAKQEMAYRHYKLYRKRMLDTGLPPGFRVIPDMGVPPGEMHIINEDGSRVIIKNTHIEEDSA
jgi:hypothetical protein